MIASLSNASAVLVRQQEALIHVLHPTRLPLGVVHGPGLGAAPPRLGWLTPLAIVMAWAATRAFRSYQRSA